MEFRGKDIKEIVVTLPFADGTNLDCGVFAYFQVGGKDYFALLPLTEDGQLDFANNYMLYRIETDEEDNPIVLYIESDMEYTIAANYFADNYLK